MTPSDDEGLREAVEKCFVDNDMTDSGEPTHYDDIELFDTEQVVTDIVALISQKIIDELIALRDIEGSTVDAWAVTAYQQLLDRIAALTTKQETEG